MCENGYHRTGVSSAQTTPPGSLPAPGAWVRQEVLSPQLRERWVFTALGTRVSLLQRPGLRPDPSPVAPIFSCRPLLWGFLSGCHVFSGFLPLFTILVSCALSLILPLACWASIFLSGKWGGGLNVDVKVPWFFLSFPSLPPLFLLSTYHILFPLCLCSPGVSLFPLSVTLFSSMTKH